ncbi:MAG: hypothetical protein AAF456_08910 [Planctomycetota bacterium]
MRTSAIKFTIAILFVCSACVSAQTTTQDTREQPAPWRPAFSPTAGTPIGDQGTSALNEPFVVPQAGVQQAGVQQTGVQTSPPSDTNPVTAVNGNAPVSGTQSDSSGPGNVESQFRSQQTFSQQTVTPAAPQGTANEVPSTRASFNQDDSVRVSRTYDMLPNSAGQVWREYDISPYTSQVTGVEEPQQAIVEWILRETGTEMWFNRPLGILNAEKDRLFVYHTPEIQNAIRPIVDRFVRSRGQMQNVDVTLCTVVDPNWRAGVATLMQPIEVQAPAVEAWLMTKENAAQLLGQLARRNDFRLHSSGRITAQEGQHTILERTQPLQFVRNVRWTPGTVPGYQPLLTTINSGYQLSISTLSTSDGRNIEATIKCDVDQVEKVTPVNIDVPNYAGGAPAQVTVNVPQIVSWRLHERFRWPDDQVLVLSCGVVARPDEEVQFGNRLALFGNRQKRADALLFLDYRGPSTETPATARATSLGPVQTGPLER